MKNNKRPMLHQQRWICTVLALVMVLGLTACGKKQEPLRAPANGEVVTVPVETAYGTLAFPKALSDSMRHMEVTENGIAMEVFYMVTEADEKELFRIYYADDQMGTHLGYLTTDAGEIPVSYTMCEYGEKDFANEEERELYYSMMNALSVVMNSIHDNPQFSETRTMESVGDRKVELRYWKVMLPENVQYTQTEESGNYRVDFYGEVSGERINLYMIGMGNLEGETVLGMYTVDGVQKQIVVGTYDLSAYDTWPQEDKNTIHRMMDSLNIVIQTIMLDKNFTESNS